VTDRGQLDGPGRLVTVAIVVAYVVGYLGFKTAMGDPSPAELQAAEETVTSVPSANTPWYAVGAMPLLLVSGVVIVLSIGVSYLISLPKWDGKEDKP